MAATTLMQQFDVRRDALGRHGSTRPEADATMVDAIRTSSLRCAQEKANGLRGINVKIAGRPSATDAG